MITHRTLGQLATVPQLANAMRDLELERMLILQALNAMLPEAPAGEYRMILIDDTGTPAQYKLVAGVGMTITINAIAGTVTLTSP